LPRARLTLACALAALSVSAGVGFATTLVPARGQDPRGLRQLQRWVDRSRVPTPRGRVVVWLTDRGCGSSAACVYRPRPVIVFYAGERDRAAHYEFMHELGHVVDLLYLSRRERVAFKRIMGVERRPWWGGPVPPGEWFADAYAFCALGNRSARSRVFWGYWYYPSRRQQRRACALIRRQP
jgi:hypothetical protein